MRKHATSWLIKFVFLVIIIVFIFWGVGSFRARRASILAYINGEPLYYKEFALAYEQVINSYRARFKGFNEDWIKRLNLKKTVLDSLIERKLIIQVAKKMGVSASEDQVREIITHYSVFQKNGRFDPILYQTILGQHHYTPAQFEENLKRDLILSYLRNAIQGLAHISEKEAYEAYKWQKQQINLQFVTFKPEAFNKKVNVSEEKLRAYFEKHKDNYLVPRQLKIDYVNISERQFIPEIKPTNEEIEQYYKVNQSDFYQPKTVHARHILFRIPTDASKERIEKIKKKAKKVLEMAKKGEDFSKLAKRYSEDRSTAAKGGDLGWFGRNTMIKPFEDVAFSLKKGEISDLVKTRFGFHIIKVEDIKEAYTKKLPEVRTQIVQRIKKERANQMAEELANRLYAQAILDNSLKKAADDFKIPIRKTDFFSNQHHPKGIHYSLIPKILKLKRGEISPPLKTQNSYFLAQVIAEKDASVPPFSEIKKRVKEDYIKEKERELAKKAAEGFINKLKEGKEFSQLAREYKLTIQETGFFGINENIPKIGYKPTIQRELFSLGPSRPYLDKVVEIGKNFYVLKFLKRKEPDKKAFETERESFIKDLLSVRRAIFFNSWLSNLKKGADIRIKEKSIL